MEASHQDEICEGITVMGGPDGQAHQPKIDKDLKLAERNRALKRLNKKLFFFTTTGFSNV